MTTKRKRIMVVGATGFIGQAVVKELVSRDMYDVVAVSRRPVEKSEFNGAEILVADVTDPKALRKAFSDDIHVVISCLACHLGLPADYHKIDHEATLAVLQEAQANVTTQFILLSAICVKEPQLPLQFAKLKMEHDLMCSGICYTIVRPTAYFWVFDRQLDNMKKGMPGFVFGNGDQATYNPISKEDLAEFLVDSIDNPKRKNRVFPIGGPEIPENTVTYRETLEMGFKALGKEPKIRRLPMWILPSVIGMTKVLGKVIPKVGLATEFLSIFHYYSTNDMLAPGYGKKTIQDYFTEITD